MTPTPHRHPRRRRCFAGVLVGVLAAVVSPLSAQSADVADVLDELNASKSVEATGDAKSWRILFDAYLEMSEPPMPIGPELNLFVVHHEMDRWAEVSGWAESNPDMADAILQAQERPLFGLPYGEDSVPSAYREAGLVAAVAAGGDLRVTDFPYLEALSTIAAFATAESYRLMEAGQTQEGLDLASATALMLRKCCDREFRDEQIYGITLLVAHLETMRDLFHVYLDDISSEQFADIAINDLPFLRPDHHRLLMPEGDKIVARAIIESVFDEDGQAIRDKFAETFAYMQAEQEPLTVWGAARRWRMIADIHDSLDSSLERLTLVYDDWWRRWRVDSYDAILTVPTQFERTNAIRFAAVLYSVLDVRDLLEVRDTLRAAVGGTAMAAGVCGHQKRLLGNLPQSAENMYALHVRARSDKDPYDPNYGTFKYTVLDERRGIDTPAGRVNVPSGSALLWSIGPDREDQRGLRSTEGLVSGLEGDIVFWPALRALQREQGLLD